MTRPAPADPDCPYCDARASHVTNCWGLSGGFVVRRRQCDGCGRRFRSYEVLGLYSNLKALIGYLRGRPKGNR